MQQPVQVPPNDEILTSASRQSSTFFFFRLFIFLSFYLLAIFLVLCLPAFPFLSVGPPIPQHAHTHKVGGALLLSSRLVGLTNRINMRLAWAVAVLVALLPTMAHGFAHSIARYLSERQVEDLQLEVDDQSGAALRSAISVLPRHVSGIPFIQHFSPERQQHIQRRLGSSYAAALTGSAQAQLSRQQQLSTQAVAFETSVGGSRVFKPADFGADPTGVNDSSPAFEALIEAVFIPAPHSPATNKFVNLGGAIVELDGGAYSLSKPLAFPSGFENYAMQGGHISAGPNFPAGESLVSFGNATGPKGGACSNVDIHGVTLDGSNVVGSALDVLNCQYANIGPAVMVFSFTEFGIRLNGTGGGYIHHSWLGEVSAITAPVTDALCQRLHDFFSVF